MTKQRIKTAGNKVAKAAKDAGKKIGEAAVVVGDLNDDGKVDHEDARIAAAKAKVLAAKAADGAGSLMKKAGKHDMVKDAAAGAGIGALVAMPLPVIGPAVGAAVGAIAGVVKHLRTPSKSTPEGNPKPRKFSRRVCVEASREGVNVVRRQHHPDAPPNTGQVGRRSGVAHPVNVRDAACRGRDRQPVQSLRWMAFFLSPRKSAMGAAYELARQD